MQKQMWSLWLLEVLWQQWFPSSATSQSQSMTPHQGESLRSSEQSTCLCYGMNCLIYGSSCIA